MPSNQSFKLFALFIFFIISGMVANADPVSPESSILKAGEKAPVSSLLDLNDEEITFPATKHWNIVVFWSLFCHSCIEELPHFQSKLAQKEFKDVKSFLISLDTKKMKAALNNFVKKRKIENTILVEKIASNSYLTADKWKVKTTPSIFLVDPNGKITFSNEGPMDLEVLFKDLQAALKKSSKIETENINGREN